MYFVYCRYYCWVFPLLLCTGNLCFIDRYPKLKLYLYYNECHFRECTDFAIKNYDGQLTYAEKQN